MNPDNHAKALERIGVAQEKLHDVLFVKEVHDDEVMRYLCHQTIQRLSAHKNALEESE